MPDENGNKHGDLRERVTRLEERVRTIEGRIVNYISRPEFAPIRVVVYGLVGIILAAVAAGLMTQVLK